VRGDVRDGACLTEVVRSLRPDVVVHLAAETGTGQSLTEPSRHTDVNLTGTARLLEALDAGESPPRRVVLTSSRAVYGEGAWVDAQGRVSRPSGRTPAMLEAAEWDYPGRSPLPSSVSLTGAVPCNVYGATKLGQETLLSTWAVSRGVSTGIVRLQNVYGPGQSPLNPYTGITTLFFRLAREGRSIPVYEDGNIGRDFVFIDDVVRAVVAVAGRTEDTLDDVGSGTRTTILDAAREIARLCGAPEPTVTGQYRLGDVRDAACSMAGSSWLLPTPAVDVATGLGRLGDWMSDLAGS
jgi:dTDP-L-rhamnose 4-epimerase